VTTLGCPYFPPALFSYLWLFLIVVDCEGGGGAWAREWEEDLLITP